MGDEATRHGLPRAQAAVYTRWNRWSLQPCALVRFGWMPPVGLLLLLEYLLLVAPLLSLFAMADALPLLGGRTTPAMLFRRMLLPSAEEDEAPNSGIDPLVEANSS